MHDIVREAADFIALNPGNIAYLFFVGFVGGLVSGFIGSGGAFVLTPAMMSLGVPGLVAVASNMCHKFPKALIGAIKRAKYGQVDLKLGIILAGSLFGIQLGAIGTTYVKPVIIKVVMGTIMVIVLFSRGLMVPVYMSQLGLIPTLNETTVKVMTTASFWIMTFALLTGAAIVLHSIWQGRRANQEMGTDKVYGHGQA